MLLGITIVYGLLLIGIFILYCIDSMVPYEAGHQRVTQMYQSALYKGCIYSWLYIGIAFLIFYIDIRIRQSQPLLLKEITKNYQIYLTHPNPKIRKYARRFVKR